jgi:hypothetical protein
MLYTKNQKRGSRAVAIRAARAWNGAIASFSSQHRRPKTGH